MFYHIILVVVYLPPKGTLNSESLWQKQRRKLLSVAIRSSVDALNHFSFIKCIRLSIYASHCYPDLKFFW